MSERLDRLCPRGAEDDPREVWETVGFELGDAEWLKNSKREYGEHIPGELIYPSDRPPTKRWPTSITSIRTIASDANGILLAERHARRFSQCLENFGANVSANVVWYFTENPFSRSPFEMPSLGRAFLTAQQTLEMSLDDQGIDMDELRLGEISPRLPEIVDATVAAWGGWRIATTNKFRITSAMWPFDNTRWEYFSDLDNPFEPLLFLWATGYRISVEFTAENPEIRLYAKPYG